MRIGCLGWGSLIWDPRDLPFRGIWFRDGPLVPIEFARQSKDDRITLVLVPGRPVVRSLWSVLSVRSLDEAQLDEAQTALAKREGTGKENIGVWKTGTADANTGLQVCQTIGQWATGLALDAVVWTALPPKFKDEQERVPTVREVVGHLSNLPHEKRRNAEEYIRRAPRQIDTDYRRQIEADLHWTPVDARAE